MFHLDGTMSFRSNPSSLLYFSSHSSFFPSLHPLLCHLIQTHERKNSKIPKTRQPKAQGLTPETFCASLVWSGLNYIFPELDHNLVGIQFLSKKLLYYKSIKHFNLINGSMVVKRSNSIFCECFEMYFLCWNPL